MVLRRTAARIAAGVVAVMAIAGCAGGGGAEQADTISGSELPAHSTVSAPRADDVIIDPTRIPVGGPGDAVVGALTDFVMENFGSATVASALGVVENGDVFADALDDLGIRATTVTIRATQVEVRLLDDADCSANMVPSPCAVAEFSAVSNDGKRLPRQTQVVFATGDSWTVSAATFCALLESARVVCDDSNIPSRLVEPPSRPAATTTTTTTTTTTEPAATTSVGGPVVPPPAPSQTTVAGRGGVVPPPPPSATTTTTTPTTPTTTTTTTGAAASTTAP